MSEFIFGYHDSGRGRHWPLVGRGRGAVRRPAVHRALPAQDCWSNMSTVLIPRWRCQAEAADKEVRQERPPRAENGQAAGAQGAGAVSQRSRHGRAGCKEDVLGNLTERHHASESAGGAPWGWAGAPRRSHHLRIFCCSLIRQRWARRTPATVGEKGEVSKRKRKAGSARAPLLAGLPRLARTCVKRARGSDLSCEYRPLPAGSSRART